MHFELGNRSGWVQMGPQLANLAAVRPVWQRDQNDDFGGRKSTFPPRSRKVIYGSAGSKYASKSIPACILRSGTGLVASKWGPNWQIWLCMACMTEGSKSRLWGSKIKKNSKKPQKDAYFTLQNASKRCFSPSKRTILPIFPFKMHQNADFPPQNA